MSITEEMFSGETGHFLRGGGAKKYFLKGLIAKN